MSVNQTVDYFDEFESYEDQFNPLNTDRQARRKRKPKANHQAKKSQTQVLIETANATGVEGDDFITTYTPARYEKGWLLESVRSFYQEELISDILAQVKGGKEASVYRCQAHPVTGLDFLAAKIYRPRQFRNLSNDKMYREGRQTLNAEGKPVKKTDHRIKRALGKKSSFGVQVAHTSWLMYEYTTMQRLSQAGAAVPEPFGANDNAILMSYLGDEQQAAHTLNEISLERDEAEGLFQEVLRNIDLMLQHNFIHGDLSAYNILYWQGEITLIDFPQVTNSQGNKQAPFILKRDVTRICQYFAQQGVRCNPESIFDDLWQRYLELPAQEQAAEHSLHMLDQDYWERED